jgi:hypothetical protein
MDAYTPNRFEPDWGPTVFSATAVPHDLSPELRRHALWMALVVASTLCASNARAQGPGIAPDDGHGHGADDAAFGTLPEDASDGYHWRSRLACGASCTYYFLKIHGLDAKLAEVRSLVPIDPARGSRLSDMVSCCQRLGLYAYAVSLTPANLGSLDLPVILHLNVAPDAPPGTPPGHYVVLLSTDRDRAMIFDPASPQPYRHVPFGALMRDWSGAALMIDPYRNFLRMHAWELVALTLTAALGLLLLRRTTFKSHHEPT